MTMIYLTFVLKSLKGHCYGHKVILGANEEHCLILPLVFVLAFHKQLEYCHQFCINALTAAMSVQHRGFKFGIHIGRS